VKQNLSPCCCSGFSGFEFLGSLLSEELMRPPFCSLIRLLCEPVLCVVLVLRCLFSSVGLRRFFSSKEPCLPADLLDFLRGFVFEVNFEVNWIIGREFWRAKIGALFVES